MDALYLTDSYLRDFRSFVTYVEGTKVELSRTAFYPTGGGQPNDTGRMRFGNDEFAVLDVKKNGESIVHYLNEPPSFSVHDEVRGELDWERRYIFMRMHTASHILASIFYSRHDALITGNHIGLDKTRFDFSVPDFDRNKIDECVQLTNEAIGKNADVKISFLKREEALKIPAIVKLAGALPPSLDMLRIVEIDGIDIQADGGTHVANTKEIGKIELVSMENKGKDNRRVYFRLC